jgi:hypothetical protein
MVVTIERPQGEKSVETPATTDAITPATTTAVLNSVC